MTDASAPESTAPGFALIAKFGDGAQESSEIDEQEQ
jgi:hypothetical protein